LGIWQARASKQKHLLMIVDSNFAGAFLNDEQSLQKSRDVSLFMLSQSNEICSCCQLGLLGTHNLLKFLERKVGENCFQLQQTPTFVGDFIECKRRTNLYLDFKTWPALQTLIKADYVTIDYENGRYVGQVLQGKKHYWGTFTWSTGPYKDCKYIGQFENGALCGKGVLFYKNGRIYQGDFKGNTQQGRAEESYANGDRYVGEFDNGQKRGQGEYRYQNGDVYSGQFEENVPHGIGTLLMKNRNRYEGEFRKGKCAGKGTFRYNNGDVYEGDWADSQKHGKGVYRYANGDVYMGEFFEGLRHGSGKMVTANGDVFEGTFFKDMKHGPGLLISEGKSIAGEWKNDLFA
jgi:hypothetical protein